MTTLMFHKDTVFEDQVVYLSGHAYSKCTFRRCTLVVRDQPSVHLDSCSFDGCNWHLDLLVHDSVSWQDLVNNLFPMIAKSLPKVAGPDSAAN